MLRRMSYSGLEDLDDDCVTYVGEEGEGGCVRRTKNEYRNKNNR